MNPLYALADPLETQCPSRWAPSWSKDLTSIVPESQRLNEFWQICGSEYARLDRGWKLHVSATADSAAQTLSIVRDELAGEQVCYKFLQTSALVVVATSKYNAMTSFGKFITIYPQSQEDCARLAHRLSERLAQLPAPLVYTDKQWRDESPVFFRYGDHKNPAIERPDERAVPFALPSDAQPTHPDIVAALASPEPMVDLPLTVVRAVQQTSAGGVYIVRDRNAGTEFVLKEARPYADSQPGVSTSQHRLHDEARVLAQLQSPAIPSVVATAEAHGHFYVQMTKMPGVDLRSWVANKHPLLRACADSRFAEYTATCAQVVERLQRIVEDLHRQGIAHGDLHPGNVLVDEDLTVSLIDFELAQSVHDPAATRSGCPGFRPAGGTAGEADVFAVQMIHAWLLSPTTTGAPELDPAVLWSRGQRVAELNSQAAGVIRKAATLYAARGRRRNVDDVAIDGAPRTERVVRGLLESLAQWPDKPLSTEPGSGNDSMRQLNVGQGAAGVALALHAIGESVPSHVVDALRAVGTESDRTLDAGLWTGTSGIALTLATLGCHDDALRLAETLKPTHGHQVGWSLSAGRAGIIHGLMALSDATGADKPRAAAMEHAALLEREAMQALAGGDASLMEGTAGVWTALRRVNSEEPEARTGSLLTQLADHVRRALVDIDGGYQLRTGAKYMPYLANGSLGVAQIFRSLGDEATVGRILRSAAPGVVLLPGLCSGIVGLAAATAWLDPPGHAMTMQERERELTSYCVDRESRTDFLGMFGDRISSSLAHGSAGYVLYQSLSTKQGRATFSTLFAQDVIPPGLNSAVTQETHHVEGIRKYAHS